MQPLGLGVNVDEKNVGTYELLEHTAAVEETIINTSVPHLDLIPSHIDLVAIEIELVDKNQREFMLKKALENVIDTYDFILIDCAPSLGLITLNALTAANCYNPHPM